MDLLPPVGRISDAWKLVESDLPVTDAVDRGMRTTPSGEQPSGLPAEFPLSTLNRGLILATSVGLGVLLLIYLIYRGHTLFLAVSQLHPAFGIVYLVAVAIVGMGASSLAILSLQRYRQIEVVSHILPILLRVQRDRAGVQDQRLAYDCSVRFAKQLAIRLRAPAAGLLEVERKDLVNQARRVLNSLRDHRGGKTALHELEQTLLTRLDAHADRIIGNIAISVAIGTSLASGILDSIIVGTQSLRLIDQIATLYAGRPGMLGTLRLLRRALLSIAFAEIAEALSEAVVHASTGVLLAKLGGRAIQGFSNGLLLVRLGESVKQQCRLLPSPKHSSTARQLLDAMLGHVSS